MSDVLWLDTSVMRIGPDKLEPLAELAKKKRVPVLVHPHIYLEYCRHQRGRLRKKGAAFEQSMMDSYFGQLEIKIVDVSLTRARSEEWAKRLDERYPTADDWKRAKLKSVRARLASETIVREEKVPMTTDWHVAFEVEDQDGYIAVGDKGEEWAKLREATPPRAMSYDDAIQWLESHPNPT